jgi:dUTP pyrophosphatase
MQKVLFEKIRASATMPQSQTSEAAGLDLFADIATPLQIAPLQRMLISTGIAIALPKGYEAQIRPRSGLAYKYGITVLNSPGTIDSDYRGEIKVLLINLSDKAYVVHPQDRIAQMVIAPVTTLELIEVDRLSETKRGSGGFGSTGK